MSNFSPQNLKNHVRWDPSYHLIFGLVLLANIVYAVVHLWRQTNISSAWYLFLSFVVFIPYFKARQYPIKVQDRIIRLEERIRLQALAPAEWHAQIYRLSEDQLIGLRFAADDEVVELAKQALEHNLNRKQIKERIKSWRPDNWRV